MPTGGVSGIGRVSDSGPQHKPIGIDGADLGKMMKSIMSGPAKGTKATSAKNTKAMSVLTQFATNKKAIVTDTNYIQTHVKTGDHKCKEGEMVFVPTEDKTGAQKAETAGKKGKDFSLKGLGVKLRLGGHEENHDLPITAEKKGDKITYSLTLPESFFIPEQADFSGYQNMKQETVTGNSIHELLTNINEFLGTEGRSKLGEQFEKTKDVPKHNFIIPDPPGAPKAIIRKKPTPVTPTPVKPPTDNPTADGGVYMDVGPSEAAPVPVYDDPMSPGPMSPGPMSPVYVDPGPMPPDAMPADQLTPIKPDQLNPLYDDPTA